MWLTLRPKGCATWWPSSKMPQPRREKVAPVVADQRDMVFVPRVMAVQHGQAVRFENSDLCNHSVLAASTLSANQFNVLVPFSADNFRIRSCSRMAT